MTYWDKKLIREQLDLKLDSIKKVSAALNPDTGWIRLMREALSMSSAQLGKKTGVDQSRISRLENAEVMGDLKLSSLKKIADGLNMKFVYGFIPENTLETMMKEQARKIALKRMAKLNHTMRLEDQELTDEEKNKALEDLVQKILIEQPKNFWDL